MINTIILTYKNLSSVEENGKKIGLFRTLFSVFGGLILTYLAMTLLVVILPFERNESIIIALILTSLIWALSSLWIVLSHTKSIVLLKVIIPSIIFTIAIIILGT